MQALHDVTAADKAAHDAARAYADTHWLCEPDDPARAKAARAASDAYANAARVAKAAADTYAARSATYAAMAVAQQQEDIEP
jgi:hypothetical protein